MAWCVHIYICGASNGQQDTSVLFFYFFHTNLELLVATTFTFLFFS
jgi:hypothetical protein